MLAIILMSFDVTGHSVSSSLSDRMAEPSAKRVALQEDFSLVASARGFVKSFGYQPRELRADILGFFAHVTPAITELLHRELWRVQFKVSMAIQVRLEKKK